MHRGKNIEFFMEYSSGAHHNSKKYIAMKKSLSFSLIVFAALLALQSTPPHRISGVVSDAVSALPLRDVAVVVIGTSDTVYTNTAGQFALAGAEIGDRIAVHHRDYIPKVLEIKDAGPVQVALQPTYAYTSANKDGRSAAPAGQVRIADVTMQSEPAPAYYMHSEAYPGFNTENYATIHENGFLEAAKNPLSTFSIDVDAASYSNIRRFINNGQLPPKDAVRIEEMLNYFDYDYPQPRGADPFTASMELAACPWNGVHHLLHIGIQGKKISAEALPPSNLVFLIDVSGSMRSANKLPLLKSAFRILVEQLRPVDRVAMVVYAGAAGLVLPPTPGDQKAAIWNALDRLEAGGSTAGGAGLKLAYSVAEEHFVVGGNNRIILASDGDFNIGPSSNAEMERLVESQREQGIYMTVLGFGMGNYKDDRMEIIADKGNGNYAYIDNISEARKVLVNEFGGTLFTIAGDVKIQIEFNPAHVRGYRLIGYENRLLSKEDFNDDRKDAGELGSGHTVTALYEIIPAGIESAFLKPVDPLKYQHGDVQQRGAYSDELLTVKLRYKQPAEQESRLIVHTLNTVDFKAGDTSDNFRWSAAVAGFGMILRDSPYNGILDIGQVVEMAKSAVGPDPFGYRSECILLMESTRYLAKR
jgi:Ca-activated chloride channel family protein